MAQQLTASPKTVAADVKILCDYSIGQADAG